MEWRPIESAPKDGAEILVFTIWGKVETSFWFSLPRHRYELVEGDLYRRVTETDEGSWNSNEPTHWMPLPDPPAARANRIEAPELEVKAHG